MTVALILAGVVNNASAGDTTALDQYIASYSKTFTALGLGEDLELSYQKQINHYLQSKNLPEQTRFFADLKKQRAALEHSPALAHASDCQTLQLKQIDFEIELHQDKLRLIKQYQALGKQAVLSDQGLAKSSMGKAWYGLLRKAWLTTDSKPEDLMAMGESELNRALERYRQLQAHMGYAGRDAEFSAYLAGPAFQYEEGTTPQADYESRQAIVDQHLGKLFLPNAIQPPQIKPSTLAAAMLVDGYY